MGDVIRFPKRCVATSLNTPRIKLSPEWLSLSAERDAVCLVVHGPDQTFEVWLSAEEARGLSQDLIECADDAAAMEVDGAH